MKNVHKKNMELLSELTEDRFLYQGSRMLSQSMADMNVSPAEHKELFNLFLKKTDELFPNGDIPNLPHFRIICWTKHSKEVMKKKKENLREQLQKQINIGDIYDASGKISPETLWKLICHKTPELNEKYNLESEFDKDLDSDLFCSIVAVSASLAMYSQKTAHLRR